MSKIINIPPDVKSKNTGGQETLVEGIKQLQERLDKEKEELSATELMLDNTNTVAFPGHPYKFEANGKKIIVAIDVFKSGYECKVCKGKKRTEVKCVCEEENHSGMAIGEIEAQALRESGLREDMIQARLQLPCKICHGDYVSMRHIDTCKACEGRGALLVLPETSKNLPTTGVVVSIGPRVKMLDGGMTIYGYKLGDRILFGPYSGSMVPTKAGILFKILDASASWCRVDGANDLGQFDFVLQADEI